MSVNYKAIVDAIPQVELDACMAELAIERPRIKKVFALDEDGKLMPVLDENGKQLTEPAKDKQGNELLPTNGKFMDLTNVKTAYNVIKDLKTTIIPVHALATYKAIASLKGFGFADQLQQNILSAIADGKLAKWVDDALSNQGIDIKDSQFRTKIASLKDTHGFSLSFIDQLKEIGNVETIIFQGLKEGHVQNALQKRFAGVI